MKYRIAAVNTGQQDFEDEVNALIQEGWRPIGGVCVASEGYLIQAMVKEEPPTAFQVPGFFSPKDTQDRADAIRAGEYQDIMLRHLRAQRDYPDIYHCNEPTAPTPELRDQVIREFNRSNPKPK